MILQTAHEGEFFVAGIEIHTSNVEAVKKGSIDNLWERFFQENIPGKISHAQSKDIYAVYSNYESDYNGQYNYLIGYKVTSVSALGNGLKFVKIYPGNYALFTSKEGPVAKVVYEAWLQIWGLKSSEFGGERAYKTDYEIYSVDKAKDPNKSIVDIFVGMKQ